MGEKTLIIKFGALGDVVLCTPQIESILNNSNNEVWLLTSPQFTSLFSGNKNLKIKALPRKGFVSMLKALSWIRSQNFEEIFDFQGSDRSKMLCLLSGSSKRIGFKPKSVYTHRPESDNINHHVFHRLNKLLLSAGLPAAEPKTKLWIDSKTTSNIDRIFKDHELESKKFAIIHPGSSSRWLSKRWSPNHFVELAKEIEENGLKVIWIGGPEDVELNQTLAIQLGINLTSELTIPELSKFAEHAKFAITNDSGPMHVISTAGIPIFTFFGPTDWKRHHAIGNDNRVLYKQVECGPCYLETCPEKFHHQCLEQITTKSVFQKIQDENLI